MVYRFLFHFGSRKPWGTGTNKVGVLATTYHPQSSTVCQEITRVGCNLLGET